MQSTTKQWYVHTGSQQEGPLVHADMVARIAAGSVLPQHFAWSPGMQNWIPISEIPELNSIPTTIASSEPTSPVVAPSNHDLSALIEISQHPEALEPTGMIEPSRIASAESEAKTAENFESAAKTNALKQTARTIGKIISVLFIAVALVGVGVLLWLSSDPNARDTASTLVTRYLPLKLYKAPSSFPLSDVERAQFEEIANGPTTGARTFALSIGAVPGQANPGLYFAGPWVDQSTLTVMIKGDPMSLVGVTEHHDQVSLTVRRRFGTAVLNKALPRGDYTATVTDPASGAIVGQLKIAHKDANYAKDLNAYHDSVVAKIRTEIQQLRSIADLAEGFSKANAAFIATLNDSKGLIAWKAAALALHKSYAQYFEQLSALTATLKPDTLKADFNLWTQAQGALRAQQLDRSIDQVLEEVLLEKVIAPRWKSDQAKIVELVANRTKELEQLRGALSSSETSLNNGQFISLLENAP